MKPHPGGGAACGGVCSFLRDVSSVALCAAFVVWVVGLYPYAVKRRRKANKRLRGDRVKEKPRQRSGACVIFATNGGGLACSDPSTTQHGRRVRRGLCMVS